MRTRYVFGTVLMISCLALAGCGGGGKSADVIKVGWFGSLTGDTAVWGQSELNTIKMLFEDYNAKGGIKVGNKTYKIEVIGYDDKGDGNEAVNVVKRLTSQDHVNAIIGPNASGEAIPVGPVAEAAKTPIIATVATNPKVTVVDGRVNPFMFRDCFIDPYQGKVAATYAYQKLGKRNAAIFMNVDDDYSQGLSQFFKENFEKLGGKVVVEVSFRSGDVDFRPQLSKMKAANPDFIFSPNFYKEVALSAKQARDLGITSVMMGGDGWPSENLIPMAGTALEGCYYVNHLDFNDPSVAPFKDAYKAKYNLNCELNGYLAHDAVLMLVDAIQRAGSLDGTKIAQALETCDIQGITGHIKIGKDSHNPEGKEAAIIKIVGKDNVFQEKFAASD
jgi:branched-chain amino acid transport system substrate-binding protein